MTGDTGGGGGANSSRSYFGGDTAINQGTKQVCSVRKIDKNKLRSDQALYQSHLGCGKNQLNPLRNEITTQQFMKSKNCSFI